jgi:hypothetical protein
MGTTPRLKTVLAAAALLTGFSGAASAFCGFYVAKADSKLFNKSSKVVLARKDNETAITMASDYQGEPKEFALVIPVPTFIERKQIGVVEMQTIDHLDAYTAPRLVEYEDPDPCAPPIVALAVPASGVRAMQKAGAEIVRYRGVTVEASYDVAEYDVSILSAKESDGLGNWLTDNGYRLPAGAAAVLGSYIRQGMRVFVAKVNLERMQVLGNNYLRPLQVRYQSAKFMLPLRLGTVNADGPQDLIVNALTRSGRVEASNYSTVKVPSDVDIPLYVKQDFGAFYKAMFDRAVARGKMRAVFVEYAWDMGWCDPCAANPLSNKELVELGVRWIADEDDRPFRPVNGTTVFVTRMHVRYDAETFPEDLVFLETSDRTNFQGRYILRHPWTGEATCPAADSYRASLPGRYRKEAETLASMTGWARPDIEDRMAKTGQPVK